MAKARKKRPQFTTKEKAMILRRHMVDKVPVSDLCGELGIQPSVVLLAAAADGGARGGTQTPV